MELKRFKLVDLGNYDGTYQYTTRGSIVDILFNLCLEVSMILDDFMNHIILLDEPINGISFIESMINTRRVRPMNKEILGCAFSSVKEENDFYTITLYHPLSSNETEGQNIIKKTVEVSELQLISILNDLESLVTCTEYWSKDGSVLASERYNEIACSTFYSSNTKFN